MSETTNYPKPNKKLCIRGIKAMESEWQNLPMDVAFLIQDKLFEPVDHLCFAKVCKEWESLSKDYNKGTHHLREGKVLPIFWNSTDFHSKSEGHPGLQSISTEKRYNKIRLPLAYGKRCCGSSHGWLATVDLVGLSLNITLVYPFKKSVAPICLPPLDFMIKSSILEEDLNYYIINYKKYIPNVILSANPNLQPDNYLVIALYHCDTKLAFIKGGQEHWKDWVYLDRRQRCLHEVTFYKNQIFIVGSRGRIVSFDVNYCNVPRKRPKAKRLTPPAPFRTYAANSYLVKSSKGDHLWHVRRLLSFCNVTNIHKYREKFMVYKVMFDLKNGAVVQQVEVKSIGDEALFLGGGHSVSVLASNFPGCKPNSIYYTNYDVPYFEHACRKPYRIFSLENQNVTLHEVEFGFCRRSIDYCAKLGYGKCM
ncbi:hypothetical protein ACLB2K_039243 [Fragaria x ananassa]